MYLNWWQIYLWLKLDTMQDFCFCFPVFVVVFICIYVFIFGNLLEDTNRVLKFFKSKLLKILIFLSIIFLILGGFLPSSKQFALIYVLPKIVNSKTVQEIFNDTDETMTLLLKYAKEELRDKLKENKSKIKKR